MKCKDCPYCYKTEEDRFPCCHYPDDGTPAPCEYEDKDLADQSLDMLEELMIENVDVLKRLKEM